MKSDISDNPDVTQESNIENMFVRFELFKADDFKNLKRVSQICGLILDEENRILIVSGRKKMWILPGGGIESGEEYIDTLNREVYEEAAVILIQNCIDPLFYQKVYWKEDDKWEFKGIQARYIARIKKKDTFVEDTDLNDIIHQKYVSVENLEKHLDWGRTTKFIKALVLKKLEEGF